MNGVGPIIGIPETITTTTTTMTTTVDPAAQTFTPDGSASPPRIIYDKNATFDEEGIPNTFFVQAQYDFTSTDGSALSFSKGDVMEVLTQLDSGWWDGLIDGKRGWMPCNYVKRVSDQEAEEWFIAREAEEKEMELADDDNQHGRPANPSGNGDLARTRLEREAGFNGLSYTDGHIGVAETDLEGRDLNSLAYELLDNGDTVSDARGGFEGSNGYQGDRSQDPNGTPADGGSGSADDFWVPSLTNDGQVSCPEI